MVSIEQVVTCADCNSRMKRIEEIKHPTVQCRFLEFYQCINERCQRKLVLQWERPDGELTKEDVSWVEREVMARGSWFPGDSY